MKKESLNIEAWETILATAERGYVPLLYSALVLKSFLGEQQKK